MNIYEIIHVLNKLENEIKECKQQIADDCKKEGYPTFGENYDLRVESLTKSMNEEIETICEEYSELPFHYNSDLKKWEIENKKFLAQIIFDDGSISSKICTENEIIKLTNENDFNGISEMKVYEVTEFGKIVSLNYVGWQKNCLIQYTDDNGNIVINGYGENH